MGPGAPIRREDRERFAVLRELGCVVSQVFFRRLGTPGDVHHLLEGGQRLGHHATICLHPWYHRGQPPLVRRAGELRQLSVDEATACYGPSLALDRAGFEQRFAPELELLVMQDELIAMHVRCVQEAN